MILALGQGLIIPWDKILITTRPSCHFGHLLPVLKNLWRLILYNNCYDFIHVYSPEAGADNPLGTQFWCQQEHLVTSVICCKFQKNLFEVRFYTIFFMILYMYTAPGRGRQPQGTSLVVNWNILSLHSFVSSSKKNVLLVWFYTFFFMI